MSSEPTHINECLPDLLRPERVREVLNRPFPSEAIKTRPGSFGQTLSYVEASHYITRLNECFGCAWSFTIVQHEVLDQEVIVVGKLTTLGHVRMAFGGSTITRAKESGEVVSIADDLKAAATDIVQEGLLVPGDRPAPLPEFCAEAVSAPRERQRERPPDQPPA